MELVKETFGLNYAAYDQASGLDVLFHVYNITTGTAVFEQTVPGVDVGFGAYTAQYTGQIGQMYLVIGVVDADLNRAPWGECYLVGDPSISVPKFGFTYAAYDQNPSLTLEAHVYEAGIEIDTFALVYVAYGVYLGIYTGVLTHEYDIVSIVPGDPLRAPACENFNSLSFYGVLITNVTCEAVIEGQDNEATLEGPELSATLEGICA